MSGPSEPSLRDHRVERNRRLSRNVRVGIAGRAANALLALATVPILIRLLGAERYGIYVTITVVLGWIQLGIFGTGKGLVNTLIGAHARGDEAEARRSLWSFWAGLAAVVGGVGLLAAAVFPFIPWTVVFPLPAGITERELSATIALSLVFTLLALALSPVTYVFSAYQDDHKATAFSVVRNGATLAALGAVFAAGASMPRVALAVGSANLAASLGGVVWLLARDKPFLRARAGDVRWDHLRRAVGPTLTFFTIDAAALLAYQADKLLILQFAGARAVAAFEMASIPFLLAQSVFGVVLQPMWPALGDAVRRGDESWARGALGRLARWSTLGMLGVTALAVAAGPAAIRIWAGTPEVVPARTLLALVGAYYVVRTFTECHTIVLFSLDRQREMVLAVIANGVLTVALGIALGRAYGLPGVALSNVLALTATQAIAVPMRARRRLAALAAAAPR